MWSPAALVEDGLAAALAAVEVLDFLANERVDWANELLLEMKYLYKNVGVCVYHAFVGC